MNLILAILATLFLYKQFNLDIIWNVLFLVGTWLILRGLKKKIVKFVFIVAVALLIAFYPKSTPTANFVPNKTYIILSSGNEGVDIGYHNVDSSHLEIVKASFPEDVTFVAYATEKEALESLKSGTISRLVIENGEALNQFEVVGKINAITEPIVAKDMSSEPFLVYVSGLDTDASEMTRARSDMNLLLAINPQTKKASLVSLARDTYLPLACREGAMDKLTHTGLYGVDCQIDSVENLLDVQVDFYVRVQFNGFVDFIDTMGGITVHNPEAFETFPAGDIELDGAQALRYVRSRLEVAQGDVGRGLNAQQVLMGIINEINASDSRTRLLRNLYPLIDTNIDFANGLKLSQDTDDYQLENAVLRGVGDMQETYSQDDGYKYYIFRPDTQSIREIHDLITNTLAGESE